MFYAQFQAQEKLLVALLLLIAGSYGLTSSTLLQDNLVRIISSPEVSADYSDGYISQTDGNDLGLLIAHALVYIQYKAG